MTQEQKLIAIVAILIFLMLVAIANVDTIVKYIKL
jgi:hypothetical protein